MLADLLHDDVRVGPEKAKDVLANAIRPDASVEMGLWRGDRIEWASLRVHRTADEFTRSIALVLPAGSTFEGGEPEEAESALVYSYQALQGFAVHFRVAGVQDERTSAGATLRLVLLSLPLGTYRFDRRTPNRVKCDADTRADVRWPRAEDPGYAAAEGTLEDLSTSGGRVHIASVPVQAALDLTPGTLVTASLGLGSVGEPRTVVQAEVVRAVRDPETPGKVLVGVRWLDPQPGAAAAIARYVEQRSRASLHSSLQALKGLSSLKRARAGDG